LRWVTEIDGNIPQVG